MQNQIKYEVDNIKTMIDGIQIREEFRKLAKSELNFKDFFLKGISSTPLQIE